MCDDLTGGGDVGSQFVSRGLKTRLQRSCDSVEMPPSDTEVWIINTSSRSLSPDDAASRVRKALKALKEFKPDYTYKKIDSTLRGNIGSELEVCLSELNLDYIPVCAAFPAMGRTTLDGVHYVDGKIITDTHYASDASSPVHESNIRKLLTAQMEHPEKIEIKDAVNDKDMLQISLSGKGNFFAGASAWAGFLADTWMASRRNPEPVVFSPVPVLIFSGSLNPVTRQQINYYNKVKKDSSKDFLIMTPSARKSGALKKTARQARKIFLKSYTRALLAGGDTADEFLKELDADSFKVISSPMPGVSLISCRDWLFILKPGGFGEEDTIVRLSSYLGGN